MLVRLLLLVALIWFAGCSRSMPARVHNPTKIKLPPATQENTWAKQTNIPEHQDMVDRMPSPDQNVTTYPKQPSQMPVARIPFPAHEYRSFSKKGTATVYGKIYLLDLYDRPVVGAHTRLYLNPVTSYSKQWYEQSYLQGKKMQKPDPRLFEYLRFTMSDKEGNFTFYQVPAGKYFLVGYVMCGLECGFDEVKKVRIATVVTIPPHQKTQQNLIKRVKL